MAVLVSEEVRLARDHIAQRLTAEQTEQAAGLLSLLVADTAAGVAVAARFPATRTSPQRAQRRRILPGR